MAGLLSRFFGRTASEGAAFALGVATGPVLAPAVESIRTAAWATDPTRPLEPGDVAEIVAEDVQLIGWGENEALLSGMNNGRFDSLVNAVLNAPGISELLTLYRRGDIGTTELVHGFRKARLETQWDGALEKLKDLRLDPAVIANAIVRGIMTDPGFLPVGPPSAVGKVKAFPVSPLDPIAEAAASGIDAARLFVETAIAGRPMSPESAAAATFRGIIDPADYDRAIAEGDVRNEWAASIFETARQIPTSSQFIEEYLRGWSKQSDMYDGTARHGMSPADTDTLFNIAGRPLSWHQVWIGLQRGGTYNGPTSGIDPAFLKALRESNIRPEWYNLAWAQRYTYPSAFVLRSLTQEGDLTQPETEQILLFIGWEPTLANTVSTKWAAGTGTNPDVAREKLATTQAIAALKRRFLLERTDSAGVLQGLATLGVGTAAAGNMLSDWTLEQGWAIKPLTPAQVKKLYGENTLDINQAVAELVTQHFTVADATLYLQS